MDILSLVVGAVVSIVISELYRILKKKGDYGLIKRRINRLSKSVADSDILTLSQGFPFFEVQHIETRKTARKLIFCFPDELKPQLGEKLKAGFTEMEECYLGCRSLEELGEKLNVPDFRTLVEEGKSIVATNFIHRQNGDFFNGNTFGVLRADDYSRTPDSNEHKLLHIDFFNSDYFTHKVIHHVCAELNRRKFLADISADLLNTKYFPFRTSLGISLIVEIPMTNQIIMVKRSINAAYSEGKEWIYVSVTEALTDTDYDVYTASINIQTWVQRGLWEELGLTNEYDISSLKIYDMFFEKHFCQDGLTASVRLKDHVSFEDVRLLVGKDTQLEIKEKFVVDIDGLESFIRENKANMREQTVFALKGFLARC